MKEKQLTAIEWMIGRFHYEGFIGTFCSEELIKSKRELMIQIIDEAKKMEKKQKLEKQLFIGKVSEIIGFDKTVELLRESKQAIEEI
jgi:hypothetical protein